MPKDAAFYRHLVERRREYLADAKTELAREQFELWLAEFEAQADEAEQGDLAEHRPKR